MEIINEAAKIRQVLKEKQDYVVNPIDLSLNVVPPFRGYNDIKLIILGQDPTTKNVDSRKTISCTLNLDKQNVLKRYIEGICIELGITIDNLYATNLFKYFYTTRPAKTVDVLINHLQPNLDLLKYELSEFKDIPVLTLGQPVLQLITNKYAKVREFWDYNNKTKITDGHFTYSLAKNNQLNRDLFPFPHQPSLRKQFYKNTLKRYLNTVKL